MTTTMITIDGKKFKICDQSNLCKTTAQSQATRTAAIETACTSPAMAECGAVSLVDWNLTIHSY